ncbi:MAG: hypothetical protein H3C26_07190 [Rhodocyclaceae bacterium]|nr:hypothetical protein [Rhodocyclaceae bacterium]
MSAAAALDGAARTAGRIHSLATAAEVVQSGSGLADRRQIDTVVIDLIDVIADLSRQIEVIAEAAQQPPP